MFFLDNIKFNHLKVKERIIISTPIVVLMYLTIHIYKAFTMQIHTTQIYNLSRIKKYGIKGKGTCSIY